MSSIIRPESIPEQSMNIFFVASLIEATRLQQMVKLSSPLPSIPSFQAPPSPDVHTYHPFMCQAVTSLYTFTLTIHACSHIILLFANKPFFYMSTYNSSKYSQTSIICLNIINPSFFLYTIFSMCRIIIVQWSDISTFIRISNKPPYFNLCIQKLVHLPPNGVKRLKETLPTITRSYRLSQKVSVIRHGLHKILYNDVKLFSPNSIWPSLILSLKNAEHVQVVGTVGRGSSRIIYVLHKICY